MRTTCWTTVIVSTLMLAAGACAPNAKLHGTALDREVSSWNGPLAITVTNNNFADMRVYAVFDDGVRHRIGTVTGLSSATLMVRSPRVGIGSLRLLASPIGGRGAGSSGPLQISGGQSVNFMIQPNLTTSYGMVR